MRREKLFRDTPIKMPKDTDNTGIVVTAHVTEDNILCLDCFLYGTLKARYFADKEEGVHWAKVGENWSDCMFSNVIRKCKEEKAVTGIWADYYGGGIFHFDTKEDERIAKIYFAGRNWSLSNWESEISIKKERRRVKNREKRIEQLMEKVPVVPNECEEWIKNELFRQEYLITRKEGKVRKYRCTACGVTGESKKGWRQAAVVTCPHCGHELRAETRNEIIEKKERVIILQDMEGQWIERQFTAVCTWLQSGKYIELYEEVRALIPEGQTWGKVYYGTMREADEFVQEWWDKKNYAVCGAQFRRAYLWPGNLEEVLLHGDLQRSGLAEMAAAKVRFDVNKYITSAHARTYLEYIVKGGFYNLAADIIGTYGWWNGDGHVLNKSARNIKECLKLDGNRVNRLKVLNGDLNMLQWLQLEQESNWKITNESLRWLSEKKVYVSQCEEVLEFTENANRMVNYLKKQKGTISDILIIWKDYLNMALEEGMDVTDDIVLYPKRLKEWHDRKIEEKRIQDAERQKEENRQKYRELNEKIRIRLPDVARYFYEDDTYMIIPAGTCEELVDEGRVQHHCVGSSETYMRSMAEGKTWILFLRKKAELENPYYTIEIDMQTDSIKQWYSQFNRKPDADIIEKLLAKYKKVLQKQVRKIA